MDEKEMSEKVEKLLNSIFVKDEAALTEPQQIIEFLHVMNCIQDTILTAMVTCHKVAPKTTVMLSRVISQMDYEVSSALTVLRECYNNSVEINND